MPQPTAQDIATQLEAYRIAVATKDHVVNVLTQDLARASVKATQDTEKITALEKELSELKNPTAAASAAQPV